MHNRFWFALVRPSIRRNPWIRSSDAPVVPGLSRSSSRRAAAARPRPRRRRSPPPSLVARPHPRPGIAIGRRRLPSARPRHGRPERLELHLRDVRLQRSRSRPAGPRPRRRRPGTAARVCRLNPRRWTSSSAPSSASSTGVAAPSDQTLSAFCRRPGRRDHEVPRGYLPAQAGGPKPITIGGDPATLLEYDCGILINLAATVHKGVGYQFLLRDPAVHASTDQQIRRASSSSALGEVPGLTSSNEALRPDRVAASGSGCQYARGSPPLTGSCAT